MIPLVHHLKISGRSGCIVSIKEYDEHTVVRKTSATLAYNQRLQCQMFKQQTFLNIVPNLNNYKIPRIYSSGFDEKELYFFEMQYIHGDKFSDYLVKISLSQINLLELSIRDYFEKILDLSNNINVSEQIILNKVDDVVTKIKSIGSFSEEFKNRIYTYLSKQIPPYPLPIGICHGDFTFSNMLFGEDNQIHLFDFLDSFIESPIIDIVKLKQDTRFNWSLEVDEKLENYKIVKVLQVLKYLDKKLDTYIHSLGNEIFVWYKYLEIMNLVRILPYVSIQKERDFLIRNINSLILEE